VQTLQGCSSPTCPGGNFPAAGAGDCRPIGPGHAGHRNRKPRHLRSLGRIAWKTLLYFEIVTTFALVLGAIAIHISRAGEGITLPATISANDSVATMVTHPGVESFLLNMFPKRRFGRLPEPDPTVAIFAILFGISLALLPEQKRAPMLALLTSLTDTMFQFTKLIMYFAPIAAGAAMSYTVGSMGLSTLLSLGKLVATFYGAAIAFVLLVLLPIVLLNRIPLRRFIDAVSEPAAIAFATSTLKPRCRWLWNAWKSSAYRDGSSRL